MRTQSFRLAELQKYANVLSSSVFNLTILCCSCSLQSSGRRRKKHLLSISSGEGTSKEHEEETRTSECYMNFKNSSIIELVFCVKYLRALSYLRSVELQQEKHS